MLAHLTFSTPRRLPLAPTGPEAWAIAHLLGRLLPRRVVVWHVVDDHMHVVLTTTSAASDGRSVRLGLRGLGHDVSPAYVVEVADRAHLTRVVPYVLGQAQHHGFSPWQAVVERSSFPDLVGARSVPGLGADALRGLLPRVGTDELWRMSGLGRARPASDAAIGGAGVARLVSAACRAAAAPMEGRSSTVVGARNAVAALAARAGLRLTAVADALGVSRRAVQGREAADDALVDAVRLQWTLADAAPSFIRPEARAPGHLA